MNSAAGKGLFITFEGGEGSGKSTQVKILAETLAREGYDVLVTREPGGVPEGETIRALLMDRTAGDWSPMAECLLFFAARTMLVERVIAPALAQGKIVICDRFSDSTRAYQSYGHGLDPDRVAQIGRAVIGNREPALTFILDLPPQEGLKRAGARQAKTGGGVRDRFEGLDTAFHERVRQGFLAIARAEPERCMLIDALQPVEQIAAQVAGIVKERL